MKLVLTKPEGYERVAAEIDLQAWTIGESLFFAIDIIDTALKSMPPDDRLNLQRMLVQRYTPTRES